MFNKTIIKYKHSLEYEQSKINFHVSYSSLYLFHFDLHLHSVSIEHMSRKMILSSKHVRTNLAFKLWFNTHTLFFLMPIEMTFVLITLLTHGTFEPVLGI